MPTKTKKTTLREEHAEGTRLAVLKSARKLFGKRGYAAVSLDEITDDARVTKGALYYYFPNKKELFRAVSEEAEQELSERALASGTEKADLLAGLQGFLDACLDPDIQQIVMRDSPSVLGWDEHRNLQAKYGLGAITTGLEAAMAMGAIEKQPVQPLAHVILATLGEGACMIAASSDADAVHKEFSAVLERLVAGLRPS
jgi:AcrR family transcriptional regulator